MGVRSDLPDGTIVLDPGPLQDDQPGRLATLLQALGTAVGHGRIVLVLTGSPAIPLMPDRQGARDPEISAAVSAIAEANRPIVAVMRGRIAGASLALALACHRRVTTADMVIDLPEVAMGTIPTQGILFRLAHLIGAEAAIRLVCEGRLTAADQAIRLGLADAVADGDGACATDRAVQLAQTLAIAAGRPGLQCRPDRTDDPGIERAVAAAQRKMPGQTAPLAAIDLIRAASTQSAGEASRAEHAVLAALAAAPQAAALDHIARAEARARAQDSGCRIGTAVVVGGGTMGASIAHALTMAGIAATIVETDAVGVSRAVGNVDALRGRTAARGLALPPAPDVRAGYDALPDAEIAIEAAFEDLGVKQAIFARLAAALPPTAVLATNTSYLDVNRIAEGIVGPDRILGLHFFSPAHVMRLVEIVRADGTSDGTLALAYGLAAQLGKIPVAAGVCDGFIGNRILTRYRQTTDVMLLEGALPWEVDAAMQDFGMAMGPYAVQDLSGLDIAYANRRRLNLKGNPTHRYVPIADRMVEDLRRLGRKTGAGWYDYAEGRATPSPEVTALIEAASARAGLVRGTFTATEIADRALTAMVDEACRILDEGIAARPSDIDLVMVHGYGFPRWRGGLMHYADTVGLGAFLDRVRRWRAQDPLSWSEGHLMARLVAEGRNLSSLN